MRPLRRPHLGHALSAAALTLALAASPLHAQVISLEQQWYRFADPGGGNAQGEVGPGDGYETDREEVGGESAEFSPDGQLIVTASRADGRPNGHPTPELTGWTAHLRLWDLEGNLIWDRPRSTAPDRNGDGRPDDQPADGQDEIEIAVFTNDGNYVAAAGEDDLVEVWQVRDLDTGAVLSEPVLVRTLTEAGAAYDELRFSNSGELLFGGTEEFGTIEMWRSTGPPSTWEHLGSARHGGSRLGQAVNALGFSSDDRYLVTAGTDQKGGFWRIDAQRSEATGEIVGVELVRLATMTGPLRSAKAARFEGVTDRHVVLASKDQRMFVYDVERLKRGDTTPVTVLHNSFYVGVDGMVGVEIEPGAYSNDGRFLVNGGGPEENFPASAAGYRSSFFRIFETAEIQDGAPEPDPVYVQPAFHTEHFAFRQGDDLLASSHDDGTVRLWTIVYGGQVTIASEAFNERTDAHDRWTLSGPLATPGDNEWGVTGEPANPDPRVGGEPSIVTQDQKWVGHRGSRYLGADNLGGAVHRLTLRETWDASGFSDLKVQFALTAAKGTFEAGDFVRLMADLDGDGAFETTVASFTPDEAGNLAFQGRAATPIFQDFFVDLAPLVPAGWDGTARLRVEARTDSGLEEFGFDSLRLIGTPGGAAPTSQTVQGEDAALAGGAGVRTRHGGFRGTGYANFPDLNGTVTFTGLGGGAGGTAAVRVRYALGEGQPRTVELSVNGAAQPLTFEPTGGWASWSTREIGVPLAPGGSNTIRLRSIGQDGPSVDEITVTPAGSALEAAPNAETAPPADFAFDMAPNPASGRATVRLSLPLATDVRVEAFDLLGRRVALLAEGAREAGDHELIFDASTLSPGLYLLRVQAGATVRTQRVTLVR